jgi:hypothetical protein
LHNDDVRYRTTIRAAVAMNIELSHLEGGVFVGKRAALVAECVPSRNRGS